MPVIINEFDIQVAPPTGAQAGGGQAGGGSPAAQQAAQASKTKPEEITSVVRLTCERTERVRAD